MKNGHDVPVSQGSCDIGPAGERVEDGSVLVLPASEEPGKTEVPRGGWALDGQDADMGRLRERLSLGAWGQEWYV